ncbi:MAG TPA: hypothetical protein VIE43_26210 [Thermoanaerobaculia bacterium]|jgi:hypothetical protein|nr:hypothetical protein [Thermoanaerobaculia bacterium]
MADEHFARVTLERFFRSELSREEARDLVRHLLRRCPQCTGVLRDVANQESVQMLLYGLDDASLAAEPERVEPAHGKLSLFPGRGARAGPDAEAKRRGRAGRG